MAIPEGWGIKKKLIRGSKKIIPRGSKKNYYEVQKKIIHVDRNAFVWKGSKNCLTDRIKKKYSSWNTGKKCICSNVSESRMVKLAVTCELYAFSGLNFSNSLYRSKQGLLHLKNSEWFVPCSGVGPQLCNPDSVRHRCQRNFFAIYMPFGSGWNPAAARRRYACCFVGLCT